MTLERRLSVAVCCGYDFRGHALNRRNCARPPRRPRGRPEAAPHPLPAAPRPESGRVGGFGGFGGGGGAGSEDSTAPRFPPWESAGSLRRRGPEEARSPPRRGQAPGVPVAGRVVTTRPWNSAQPAPNRGSNCQRTGITCAPPRLARAAPRAPRAPLASASATGADLAGPAGGLGPDPFLLLVLKSYSISFLSF